VVQAVLVAAVQQVQVLLQLKELVVVTVATAAAEILLLELLAAVRDKELLLEHSPNLLTLCMLVEEELIMAHQLVAQEPVAMAVVEKVELPELLTLVVEAAVTVNILVIKVLLEQVVQAFASFVGAINFR
jgi:hypothetical protein